MAAFMTEPFYFLRKNHGDESLMRAYYCGISVGWTELCLLLNIGQVKGPIGKICPPGPHYQVCPPGAHNYTLHCIQNVNIVRLSLFTFCLK